MSAPARRTEGALRLFSTTPDRPTFAVLSAVLRSLPLCLLVAALCGRSLPVAGQCGTTISSFPYTEDFEAAPGWSAGGTASDWAWGTPAHPLVNSAGGGVNSWCVGGLTGSFYNFGQLSYIEGPCFDLSGLQFPWISFKIFWEVERQYDGMVLQASLNGGTTWTNVGAFGDPVDCLNDNWYNEDFVNNLTSANPRHGWSGRVGTTLGSCAGGSGSGTWVTAKHCIAGLAGQPSVKFRFLFGAGTTCNDYDGIAIDDFTIGEAPPNAAAFSYTCAGNQVTFLNTSALCPTTFAWDFGDPASGPLNTSTVQNTVHTYPGPGTYTVTFTVAGPCNAPSTITQAITVLGATITTVDPVCTATSGSATASVSGGNGPYTYLWSPGGQTTAGITGIGAGSYSVTVSAPGACATTATATLNPPSNPLAVVLIPTDASCAGTADGSIAAQVSGGAAPFTYAWSPGGQSTATATGLAAGTYAVQVADAAGCVLDTSATVNAPTPLVATAMNDTTVCAGASLTLGATAGGGTGNATFAWTPGGPVVSPAGTTVYTVVATDANGCTSAPDQVTVTVNAPVVPQIDLGPPVGCAPWCVDLGTTTAGTQYTWTLGDGTVLQGASVNHCFTDAGSFDVALTVTDAAGCSGTTTEAAAVLVHPTPVAAFTQAPAVALLADPVFTLTSTGAGADALDWTFGDAAGTVAEGTVVQAVYTQVGCYTATLVASTVNGCADTTAAELCVEDEYALFAPNAFTPNGDGINDLFGVVTSVRRPEDFVLRVFDRWGGEVWSSTDHLAGWDGGGTAQGLFAWTVELRDAMGVQRRHRGHVVLLR
jgi:gliding motility-associated-like protein